MSVPVQLNLDDNLWTLREIQLTIASLGRCLLGESQDSLVLQRRRRRDGSCPVTFSHDNSGVWENHHGPAF